ncbi:MAG: GyrI-like domain-containing protein [Bacteroidota bacterium]
MEAEANEMQLEYIKRINYVLDFIEKNLDLNLSLEKLSQKAHYSSFHFHRIFSTIIGETLNEYISRKRIERIAAMLLVGTYESIQDLAFTYGFTSGSAFSRAFKKYYGVSPTEFTSSGKSVLSKMGIVPLTVERYICSIEDINKWMDMNAQMSVREVEEIKLAGIMHKGEFEDIGTSFQRLMRWGDQRGLLDVSDFKALTLYHDNPNVTLLSNVRCSACVTINREITSDRDIRPLSIQGGKYAVGQYEIAVEDFPKAWDGLCIWVLENGYSFRDGDYFEVYLNDPKGHPGQKSLVDIYIPVEQSSETRTQTSCKAQGSKSQLTVDYRQLMQFMKELRTHFQKEYGSEFKVGNLYQGSMDYSYFSLKPSELGAQQLKFVLGFNFVEMRMEMYLSGQNKGVRKKYWKLFSESNWNKYPLAESIDESLYIMRHVISEHPNLEDTHSLKEQIEMEAMKFMEELRSILEA